MDAVVGIAAVKRGAIGLALAWALSTAPVKAQTSVREHVEVAAARFKLEPDLVEQVIAVESAGDERAVSSAGAMGLMQLMPSTWLELRARLSLGDDPFDPHDNVLAGVAYLRQLLDRYGAPGFLAAYNAGPGRYEQSLAGRSLPKETLAYVAQVWGRSGRANLVWTDWRSTGLFPSPWPTTLGAAAVMSPSRHDPQGLFPPDAGRER